MKNLAGTGIRMWLNVAVISVSMIVILWAEALYEGLIMKMVDAVNATEVGGGHIASFGFDRDDRLSYRDSPMEMTPGMKDLVATGSATPALFFDCMVYKGGRAIPATMKGLGLVNRILTIPTDRLADQADTAMGPGSTVLPGLNASTGLLPAVLGTRMAQSLKISRGDRFVVKWRDSSGSFDAADFVAAEIMSTRNIRVDEGSIWLDIETLWKMTGLTGRISYLQLAAEADLVLADAAGPEWRRLSPRELTRWIVGLIEADKKNAKVVYALLLFLCSVGIFNAQIVSVFKRRREIGVLMALGLRRRQVVALFTFEGVLTCLIAAAIMPIIGAPIFYWSAVIGFSSDYADGMGMPLPERMICHYDAGLVVKTLAVVLGIMTLVSWLPVARISEMVPSKAISGRD